MWGLVSHRSPIPSASMPLDLEHSLNSWFFTGNGDVFIWVKYSRAGRQIAKRETLLNKHIGGVSGKKIRSHYSNIKKGTSTIIFMPLPWNR